MYDACALLVVRTRMALRAMDHCMAGHPHPAHPLAQHRHLPHGFIEKGLLGECAMPKACPWRTLGRLCKT